VTTEIMKQPPATAASPLVPADFEQANALATTLAKSSLLPEHFKGNVANVFWAIAKGLELGLPPIAALSGVYVVHGKPALYANTMVAVVLASGKAHFFTRVSSNDTEATYETHRIGAPAPVRRTVTLEYAKRAGWTKQNPKYDQEPQRMLEHRCKSWLAQDIYQDVLHGISSVEELRDEAHAAGESFSAASGFRAPASLERSAIDVSAAEAPTARAEPRALETADEAIAALKGAGDLADLSAAAERIKLVNPDDRQAVGAIYKSRLAELSAAAGPTTSGPA